MTSSATEHLPASAAKLVAVITAGELAARDAVETHIARIESVNPRINAVTQATFEQARADAERADALLARGEPTGPLHGVPVTVKDCFAVRGTETTLGIPGRSRGPADSDSPLVQRLRAAGAIVLGKTNVPQGMLIHECDNPLFGRTDHPLDAARSPGGSSGGEAAIVAAGGSMIGLGSDLGGSIRQPAAACGVAGFKPTSLRLTTVGSDRAIAGMQAMPIAPGPIARSVADLDLAMRAMLDPGSEPLRADERAMPWRDYRDLAVDRLRIAWWSDDGAIPVAAGVRRVLSEAASTLTDLGADVRPVEPPATEEMLAIYFGLISADGMRCLARAVRGQTVDQQIAQQLRLARVPRPMRRLLAGLLNAVGQRRTADLLRWSGPRSADEYWQLIAAAEDFRTHYWRRLDEAFSAAGSPAAPVDAVLSPPYGMPALRHGSALHLVMAASHCFLANLLDAPAGVVPFGEVREADERDELNRGRSRWAIGDRYATANAVGSTGLPLAVQVMARPWRDEIALAALAALEHARPAGVA
ncbi:MAG: amidase family protein [Planctomycetota bacterium]